MEKKENFDDQFIVETRKIKPINKRKWAQKLLVTASAALLFGVIASTIFVLFTPLLKSWTKTEAIKEIDLAPITDKAEVNNGDVTIPGVPGANTSQELQIEDLQKIEYHLYSIGADANKNIVTIRGTGESTIKEEPSSFDADETCGIIISITEKEILILAQQNTVKVGGQYRVYFQLGDAVPCEVKGYDSKTGLAVVSVLISQTTNGIQKSIAAVQMGTSKAISRGKYVIAVGNPLGNMSSVQVGIINSTSFVSSYVDGVITLLSTNLISQSKGSGFFLDEDGRLIGIITHDGDEAKETNFIKALGISDVTTNLERLANGKNIPYFGIRVSTVTEKIARENELPEGVYVESVILDSPAMATAIQKGDIIQEVGKNSVKTAKQLQQVLSNYEIGANLSISLKRFSPTGYKTVLCYVTLTSLMELK